MSKVGHYLQEHVTGEVVSSADARRHFATDGSILTLAPALVVYPHDENDVRKVARFSWQLAERNRLVPITARGAGTDQTGAALGSGVLLLFPAHMNRIVELDGKTGLVTVEPGLNFAKLQQTLMTHGRFLPAYPSSMEYSTVGGAVANNASGEKSVKYGDTRNYVKALRVVLANGEVIQTGRVSKRELNKKMGLATFEGEIYRGIDALLEEKQDFVSKHQLLVSKNTAGYQLDHVKHADGSMDLTPLFVGSQGTLGLITEITMDTEPHNPQTTLFVATFDDITAAQAAILQLRNMEEPPCAIELVDGQLINMVAQVNPNQLRNLLKPPYPAVVLLVEFDDAERQQKKATKRAQKIFDTHATGSQMETNLDRQSRLWKIRHLPAMLTVHTEGAAKALPIIEDGVVPVDKLAAYMEGLYQLLERTHLPAAIWGHAGDGHLHVRPHLDLAHVGDRQKAFRLLDEHARLVISLGGSTSGEHGDGRLRGPYLKALYGEEMYAIFEKVKQIFDPYGTLNPGVKVGVGLNDIKPLMRDSYSLAHWYEHLPRS